MTGAAARGKPIRVLIVDDHQVVADSLARLLDEVEGIEVGGVAGTVAESIAMARAAPVDVVLMDLVLPDGSGAAAAVEILSQRPETRILFLSARGDADAVLQALEAGGSGYIFKGVSGAAVVDGIRRVAAGEMLIPTDKLDELFARIRQRHTASEQRSQVAALMTARERETLVWMSRGRDNKAIAKAMFISVTTVRGYVQGVLEKLGVHSKLQAVVRAAELGLLEEIDGNESPAGGHPGGAE